MHTAGWVSVLLGCVSHCVSRPFVRSVLPRFAPRGSRLLSTVLRVACQLDGHRGSHHLGVSLLPRWVSFCPLRFACASWSRSVRRILCSSSSLCVLVYNWWLVNYVLVSRNVLPLIILASNRRSSWSPTTDSAVGWMLIEIVMVLFVLLVAFLVFDSIAVYRKSMAAFDAQRARKKVE